MLNGGGGIRGSLLRGGLLDEVSPLVAPVADGRLGTPTVFDVVGEGSAPRRLALKDVERCADDVLWPRCRAALGFTWGSLAPATVGLGGLRAVVADARKARWQNELLPPCAPRSAIRRDARMAG